MKSHKRTSGIDWVLKSGGICAIRGLNCCQPEFWHRRQNDFLTDPCISIVSDSELNHTFDDKPQYWHSETTSTNQKVNLSPCLCSVRVEMTSGKILNSQRVSSTSVWMCVWLAECWLWCCTAPWVVVEPRKALYECGSFNMQPQVKYRGARSQ